MRLLLDTHVILWNLSGSRPLSVAAREAIGQADELLFSVVSFAEIGMKAAVGKLTVPTGLREHVQRTGLRVLPLDAEHGLAVQHLPMHHRDPFDRLLIAQAQSERLTVVTADRHFDKYDVSLVNAGA